MTGTLPWWLAAAAALATQTIYNLARWVIWLPLWRRRDRLNTLKDQVEADGGPAVVLVGT